MGLLAGGQPYLFLSIGRLRAATIEDAAPAPVAQAARRVVCRSLANLRKTSRGPSHTWYGKCSCHSVMALAGCVATANEKRRPLPVDAMIPDPLFTSTDAIVDARHRRGIQRRSAASGQHGASAERWRRSLLTCGILASVLYVAMTLLIGLLWEGYSVVSRVPSELSAIGAPTRPLWMVLGTVYAVLMIAFGWIVWTLAPPNRALRVVGALLMAHTAFGYFWPPMHQRTVLAAGGGTLTDTLHLVWTMVTGLFFMFIVGFGAAALGKRFRFYSIATMAIVLACGAVTGTYASRIQADLPTPWVGVWERISIAMFMGWVAVLATALLRAPHAAATADRPPASSTRP